MKLDFALCFICMFAGLFGTICEGVGIKEKIKSSVGKLKGVTKGGKSVEVPLKNNPDDEFVEVNLNEASALKLRKKIRRGVSFNPKYFVRKFFKNEAPIDIHEEPLFDMSDNADDQNSQVSSVEDITSLYFHMGLEENEEAQFPRLYYSCERSINSSSSASREVLLHLWSQSRTPHTAPKKELETPFRGP